MSGFKKKINIYFKRRKITVVLCIVFPACMDMLWVWIHSSIYSTLQLQWPTVRCSWKGPQVSVDPFFIHSANVYLIRDCYIFVTVLGARNVA